jgi:hypothetical protein
MIGPVLGSLLYQYFGYGGAFMMFAGLLTFAGILSLTVLPNSLNIKLDVQDPEEKAMS